ncbi:MAG: DUF4142 domain-containing protein [Brevundimonas sp.]|uniref:DUF4142 domain-containing protein n=1 Tax=Brevundimonas sp. TaxID=1871086 RepID=UPI0030029D1E
MLMACAMVSVGACEQEKGAPEPIDAVPLESPTAAAAADPVIRDVHAPEGYLVAACYDDLYVLAAAKAIKARSLDPEIRALATRLETRHIQLLAIQSTFLADLGGAAAPSHLSARHAAYVADLEAAAPLERDRLWLTQQITVLLDSSLLHTTFSLHADDPRLKSHAQAASLSAQNHLDEVRRLGGDKLRPLGA